MVLRGRLKKPYPDSVAEHEEIREVIADEIKAGDVVVIPAGTGHWFTRIEDHIDYIMVRIDPDKVMPLRARRNRPNICRSRPSAANESGPRDFTAR